MHCWRNSDFPAFPVFPTESQVWRQNFTHHGLGLLPNTVIPIARDDGRKWVMASRRGRERKAGRIGERINDAKSGNTEKQRNNPYYN